MSKENTKQEILFETQSGKVSIRREGDRFRIYYGNVAIEQSLSEFQYLQGTVSSLYRYIKEVRMQYYKRFLIQIRKYSISLMLNASEIIELYELLGGAKAMFDLDTLIHDALHSDDSH